MTTSALLDNWLLQDVAEVLVEGPASDTTALLAVDRDRDTHSDAPVPLAGVQVEALISLLVDVVIRDRLVVDQAFAHAWNSRESPLALLEQHGILEVREINARTPRALQARDSALRALCATSSMRSVQAQNVESFCRSGRSADEHFGAIVWGAAGNLGRSAEAELPYSPHPIRSHVLRQTAFRIPSAGDEVVSWLRQERVWVFARSAVEGQFRQAALVLPPFVVEIIDACSSTDDLLRVAIEARDRYAPLRQWVAEFQAAIDREDAHDIVDRRRLLESVGQYVKTGVADAKFGSTSVGINLGIFSATKPVPGPGDVAHRVGIRGTLNGLVLTPAGAAASKKLVALLGEEHSTLGSAMRDHLSAAFGPDSASRGGG